MIVEKNQAKKSFSFSVLDDVCSITYQLQGHIWQRFFVCWKCLFRAAWPVFLLLSSRHLHVRQPFIYNLLVDRRIIAIKIFLFLIIRKNLLIVEYSITTMPSPSLLLPLTNSNGTVPSYALPPHQHSSPEAVMAFPANEDDVPQVSPSSSVVLTMTTPSSLVAPRATTSDRKGVKKSRAGGAKASNKKAVPSLRAPDGTLMEKPKRKWFHCSHEEHLVWIGPSHLFVVLLFCTF